LTGQRRLGVYVSGRLFLNDDYPAVGLRFIEL